jgi:Right handed beta helix region
MLRFNRSNSGQWNAARSLLVAAVGMFAASLLAPTAFAATRYVSLTGQDTGSCSDPSKSCKTIKWAIDQAQSGDIVSIADGTYVENVYVSKNLTIQGAGANPFFHPITVVEQASGLEEAVFVTAPGVTATIESMGIHNGKEFGIRNQGILTVKYAFIRNDSENGVGIQNQGTLFLERAFLYKSKWAGLQNFTNANAILNEVWVTENQEGIQTDEGSTLEVSNSLIYNNQDEGVHNKGKLTMLNVTISGNGSTGLRHEGKETSLNYVTITQNGTTQNGVGLISSGSGTGVLFANSIVSGNGGQGAKQCVSILGTGKLPSSGFSDGGYNVVADNSCWGFPSGTSIIDDPKLEASLGGGLTSFTQTYALKWGSPAVDLVPKDKCTTRDQLGVTRPIDGKNDGTLECDAGAYEFQP